MNRRYKINYNFDSLVHAIFNLKDRQNNSNLNKIQYELNRFFKDSKCLSVIYTKNTDKPFFGMCIMPVIEKSGLLDSLSKENTSYRINHYYVEIDSKLLDLDLTAREITACLLHEIGHIVNDASPMQDAVKNADIYFDKNNENLNFTESTKNYEILNLGFTDYIRKRCSIFYKMQDEIIADEFSLACGFGEDLESAYGKISRSTFKMNKNKTNILVTLYWSLKVYKDMYIRREIIKSNLKEAKYAEGSSLKKDRLTATLYNIDTKLASDSDRYLQESVFDLFKRGNDKYRNFKYRGMRTLEDELYEYNLRVKNVEEADEALILLRAINVRLAIMDDFLTNEKDLDEKDKNRWFSLMNKYRMLRDELSKKKTYDEKYYGLFINTPVVKSRYDL